jgi:hypothetical protein
VTPACTDSIATRAGPVTNIQLTHDVGLYDFLERYEDLHICYSKSSNPYSGQYIVFTGPYNQRIVVTSLIPLFTNTLVARDGNAALALGTLGRHDTLIYFSPPTDYGTNATEGVPLPPWITPVMTQLLIALAAIALWKGRRLGRLVPEQLPVVVPSGETTRGRGRLYASGQSYAHSGAALRAGAASRIASRLGIPSSATRVQLVAAISSATGRTHTAIDQLLYGPPPHTASRLMNLVAELDRLESEVHS